MGATRVRLYSMNHLAPSSHALRTRSGAFKLPQAILRTCGSGISNDSDPRKFTEGAHIMYLKQLCILFTPLGARTRRRVATVALMLTRRIKPDKCYVTSGFLPRIDSSVPLRGDLWTAQREMDVWIALKRGASGKAPSRPLLLSANQKAMVGCFES